MHQVEPICVAINPENIVVFKFLIEGYEGLAEVRTLDPKKGHLVLLTTEDTREQTLELIKSLEDALNLRLIPKPAGPSEDWLLSN